MSTPRDWARAYAHQADADLHTWNRLQPFDDVPACHKLLFLQMACEKLTKAYLCNAGSDPSGLQTSHAFTAKNLPIVVRHQIIQLGGNVKTSEWILQHTKHLSQEIELLAPAVKRGGKRPDNCEYPWEEGGKIHLPLDHSFTSSALLTAPAGRTFLKLIQEAIRQLL